ncbi:MAG: hypothetical protein HDQ95_10025 [Roseburia sp.]|nr:hypothetical protein [Roseburia sp.]
MGFVKEESCTRTANELQEKDWKYLNELGIRTMLGKKIGPAWSNLVVDREKNYYLISQGCINPNRDNRRIYYYALCLDGKVLNMCTPERTKSLTVEILAPLEVNI